MSKPKKPGTDLAALKARLAKKTKGAETPAPEVPAPGQAAPAPEVPAPGEVAAPAPEVPAPGEVAAPAADIPAPGEVTAPAADIPAPGEVAAPVADIPAPGEVAAPVADIPAPGEVAAPVAAAPVAAEAVAAAAPQPQFDAPTDGNPFGGGSMGGFDPDEGLIDGGPEIKARGSKGLIVFAALLGAVVGMAGGWLAHKISSTQEKIDMGAAKGKRMVTQVEKISDARKSVSLAMEDLKGEVAKDPKAASAQVTALLTENFDKQPQISELFGWQLAAVDPAGVKAAFKLYNQVTDLQNNLGIMAKVLDSYGPQMKVGGPTVYGITMSPGGAQLVGISASLCGEITPPAEGEAPSFEGLKPCGAESASAVAYKYNDFSGTEKIAARGLGPGQVVMLLADGKVYQYAIGMEKGTNAANFYKMALTRVEESLLEMDQAEERALAALKKYTENPNVDGSQSSNEGE